MKHAPLLFACLLGQPGGAYGPPPCVATLELRQQGPLLTLTGHCRSLLAAPARYRYQLTVLRHGPHGQAQSTQGGAFSLPALAGAVLSRVSLTAGPDDRYSARLRVLDAGGHTVAQDSASR